MNVKNAHRRTNLIENRVKLIVTFAKQLFYTRFCVCNLFLSVARTQRHPTIVLFKLLRAQWVGVPRTKGEPLSVHFVKSCFHKVLE